MPCRRLVSASRRLGQFKHLQLAQREPGQVIVLFAVFVIILMVLAGSAYDYASIVVDDARLQNAVDAAVLAGSDSLAANAALPAGTPVAIAQSTAIAYLAQNGFATPTPGTNISMTFPTSTPVGANPPSTVIENMTLNVTRNHPNSFWPLVGINSVNLNGQGAAKAQHSMLDIMMSLDTTGSLVSSHNLTDATTGQYYTTIQDAVTAFINQINPTTADNRGPKIGIGRYAGVQCTWVDSTGSGHTGTVGVVDVYPSATPQSEYRAPCTDDDTVLTGLTNDKQLLLTVASNSGTASCPASAQSAPVNYGCPIQHHPYMLPGSPAMYLQGYGNLVSSGAPYYTGTKEPNSICLVNPTDGLCTENSANVAAAGWAWATGAGARNCPSFPCTSATASQQARRVQVIMTDGQDEAWPTAGGNPAGPDPAFPESIPGYDANFQTLASHIKANPAPDGGPPVEIFVVGYFCTGPPGVGPSSYDSTQYPPYDFCQSKLAYTSAPRACPGPSYTFGSTGSPIDDLLVKVSSSTAGTCDHYFPMSKNESLSALFADLAGTISRGKLTQ
jgi:Flp pilus assembly protein TadG